VPFRRGFNRGLQLRPVNRIKHVVDIQNASVAGTQVNETIMVTVDAPLLANTKDVETGSTVNGIYLHVEAVATSSAALPNMYLNVFYNPGNNLVNPGANTVGSNDNKRYVIHQEMVMFQEQTGSNPRTVFNGVIVIPRKYRRNGPGDVIYLNLLAPGVSTNYCIQAHYKEFR